MSSSQDNLTPSAAARPSASAAGLDGELVRKLEATIAAYGQVDAWPSQDELCALLTQAADTIRRLEGERAEARGWVRWLVRQAQDDRLTEQERIGIVAHFPADEYPPHPAEAELAKLKSSEAGLLARIEELEGAVEPFARHGEMFARTGIDCGELLPFIARDGLRKWLSADDFDRARSALSTPKESGNGR